MRYTLMRKMDISNGKGIGVSLFVQGCRAHCKNCFNPETWNFTGGNEWTKESKNTFFEFVSKPYVARVTILGGEPFEQENVDEVIDVLKEVKNRFPEKQVWVYTGYKFEQVLSSDTKNALPYIDVLVDGRYVDELSDISLAYKGSSNQRIIDIPKSLASNEVVLYNI